MNYKVIIARYKENIDWIDNFSKIRDHAIVYNKGDRIDKPYPVINIPNIPIYAREADAILKYIIDNYDNLPEYIFFLQADPFDHCFNFLEVFNHIIDNKIFRPYQPLTFGWKITEGVPPLRNIQYDTREYIGNHKIYMQYANSKLEPLSYHDAGYIDIINDFRQFHKIKNPKDTLKVIYSKLQLSHKPYANYIKFNYGAMFGVKKENILTNSLNFYQNCLAFNSQHRTHVFILERLWYTIFLSNI